MNDAYKVIKMFKDFISYNYNGGVINNEDIKSILGKLGSLGQKYGLEQGAHTTTVHDEKKLVPSIPKMTIDIKDVYTTKSDSRTNEIINGHYRIKELRGFGIINQILLLAPSNDYNIYILIDGRILWNKPFSYFQNYTDYLDNLSCGLAVATYYINIKNITFQKHISIAIKTNTSITFDEILIKYTIRDERPV